MIPGPGRGYAKLLLKNHAQLATVPDPIAQSYALLVPRDHVHGTKGGAVEPVLEVATKVAFVHPQEQVPGRNQYPGTAGRNGRSFPLMPWCLLLPCPRLTPSLLP